MKLKFTLIAILAMLFGFTFTANAQQAVEVSTLDALQTALSGENETVLITETIVIPQGETVVLDLNGKTVTRKDETNQYALRNLGTLTIQDTKGNGSINARGIYNGYGDGAANVATAEITVLSGTINAKGTNGGAAIFNYGTANVNGGKFTSIGGYSLNNQAGAKMNITDGVEVTGGIYNNQDAELTVDGGNISNNRSGCHTIYAWNAKVTVNGGSIHNENSGNATIFSAGTSEVTINGGTISIKDGRVPGNGNTWTSCLTDAANTAKIIVNGGTLNGGVRVQSGATMTINGGSFNDVTGSGYNIYGTAIVNGGTFTDAAAKNFAEGKRAEGCSVVENPDGTFSVGKPVATLAELQTALAADSELAIIVTAQIVIPQGETVVLDLNGKIVNSVFNGTSTTNHIYALSNKGTLTIQDSKGNGSINSRGIYNYGSLTLNAGAINAIDGNGGYAVNNQNGSTFAMNGGVVAATCEDDHQSNNGGYDATALKVPAGCTATLNGGTINNVCDFTYAIDAAGTLNIPETSAIIVNGTHGAIYVSGGETTINAGTFQIPADEYSRTDNVLYVSGGSLVVNGGTFIGDSDTAAGGSCLYDAAGKAVVNGGTFKGSSGGDVWGTTGTTIKGGTFENLTEKQHIADGYELGEDGKVTSSIAYVAKIGEQGYATLSEAFAAVTDDAQTVVVLQDVTEELTGAYLRGNITTENGAKVTINLTNSDWVYCPYTFVLGENITLKLPALFYYAGGAQINGTVVTDAYYQRYVGTKLTINEPGSMTVTSEMCYLRYTDGDANAGIYVNGDNNDETVGLNLSVAYFYQGMIYAKDANIKTSVYWQTNETDGQGSANLVLDNSTLNVTGSELDAKATGNSTITLTNGSSVIIAGGFVTDAELSIDATSYIQYKGGKIEGETVLTGEGTEANPYLISSVDDLVLFRNSVNAGETKYNAEGVYVALGANIDLTGIDWSVNIGDDCAVTFDGIFDGKGYTISNLTATETATKADGYICTGLFGAIYDKAVVKNFTLENVTINAPFTGNNVSAVVGFAYACKGSIENVKVVGVNINAPKATGVGAIVGYDYYSPALKVENCIVDGADITAAAYAGGLVGYASSKIAMNNNTIEDVTVSATASVGAVAGIMLGGGSATDNTVKNVTLTANGALWANSAAVVAGTISGGSVTVSNTTVENVTANGAEARIVGGILVEKPTTAIAKVQAQIGDVYYTTLQTAATAAKENETITLIADVEATEALNINCALDLNGHSLMATIAPVALPEGYAALPNLDGKFVIGAQPTATVNNLGMTTVAAGEYSIWDGSFDSNTEDDGDMPLSFVMQFLADQDAEDMATSPFADWYGDFVLTFTGLENGSFTADNCYLAGHYGSFGWVKIPVDGMVIEDGVRYPVMLGVGLGQKYDYICSSVEDFKCALYLAPEILEANPNIQVKLELGVVDNSKGQDAATEALMNNDNVYSVTEYTYEALDFDPSYIAEFVIDDANPVDYTFTEEKTVGTLTYKRTLIEGIWNPLYLPFEIDVEELVENYDIAYYNQMHSYDSDNNGSFDSYEMEVAYITSGTLRANYPYFIRPKSADDCELEYVANDVTLFPAVEKKIQTSSVANIFTLSGTHKAMNASELAGCYAISVDGDWSATAGLKAHRLYLKIEENDNSPFATTRAKSIRIVVRGEGDGTTGIEGVEYESTEAIYDLSGRRVLETVEGGIYIINGKKVLVK